MKLATEETRVENLVDFIFFSGRELDWWWRRRESTGVALLRACVENEPGPLGPWTEK